MTLEQILSPYFYAKKEDRKLLDKAIQAVKDRVRQEGVSEEKIEEIMTKLMPKQEVGMPGMYLHFANREDRKAIAQAIHTEMDKAVEKL